jgi:hypothetical protein
VAENVFSTAIAASLISILVNVFIVRGTFAWLGRKGAEPRVTESTNREFAPVVQ